MSPVGWLHYKSSLTGGRDALPQRVLARTGLMLSVHGKNGMHLIFLGNLLLKCFLQQSQDFQPYSDNQIKEIEKRCIQNSEHMERSLAYVGC